MTELEEYAFNLGKLVCNLQSLEHLLRLYLAKRAGARPSVVAYGVDIYELPVGTELDVSDLTSYDTLGELIEQFNADMVRQGKREIDVDLIGLRDALAHGRVSAGAKGTTLRLVKFDRPDRKGKVRVVFRELMTTGWLSAQTRRVYEAMQQVSGEIPP